MKRLLLVDDDQVIRKGLRKLLKRDGWEVVEAGSVSEAEAELVVGSFDVVLADVELPPAKGTALLGRCGKARVVMLSRYVAASSIADAKTLGAVDYITKPFINADLVARIEHAFNLGHSGEQSAAEVEAAATVDGALGFVPPAALPRLPAAVEGMLGTSKPMLDVLEQMHLVARSDVGVLVIGESGTGKELVARAVHRESKRNKGPFVAFNCAAITETLVDSELFGYEEGSFTGATRMRKGLFESANGGTVFLDEVGELPATTQVRLLRVLQEREVRRVGGTAAWPVNVRVIAATHRDLSALVHEGKFRSDLFYRLHIFDLRLPPLRERGDKDLFLLANAVLDRACKRQGRLPVKLSKAALCAMSKHTWPGNVRELENVLERALVLCGDDKEIDAPLLRIESGAPSDPAHAVGGEDSSLEAYFVRFVRANEHHLGEAQMAERLGMVRQRFARWRQRLAKKPPT